MEYNEMKSFEEETDYIMTEPPLEIREQLDEELLSMYPECADEGKVCELERQVAELKQEIEDWKVLLEIEMEESSVLTRMLFNEGVGGFKSEYNHDYVNRELLLNTSEGKRATDEMKRYWAGSTWKKIPVSLCDGPETFIYARKKKQVEPSEEPLWTVEQAFDQLGIPADEGYRILHANGILSSTPDNPHVPRQDLIDAGYFVIR
jgi:hypothetical protein